MSFWFKRVPKGRRKRPSWTSEAMWQEMSGTFTVRLFGYEYELPITEDTEPILKTIEGALDPWSKKERRSERLRVDRGERGIQDIVNALLIQVRETSVAEAANLLGQDIKHALEPLLARRLAADVERIEQQKKEPDGHEKIQAPTPG